MTRDEALQLARAFWGEGRRGWMLDEISIAFHDHAPPGTYEAAAEPHWRIRLTPTVPYVGESRAIVVPIGSSQVREISWRE